MQTNRQRRESISAGEQTKSEQNTPLGIYFILVSTLLFSLMDGLIKWTGESYPVIQLLFFRCVFALIPISLMIWKSGGVASLKTRHPMKHFFRGVVGMLAMYCVFTSFTIMPMAEVVSILFAVPLMTSLMAVPLLGEKIGRHRSVAILIGLAGVLIIVQPGPEILTSDALYPVMAAFLMSCVMITVRILGREDKGSSISFYFTLMGIITTSVGVAFSGWIMPQGVDWLLLIMIGILGGLAQYLLTRSFAVAEVAAISPFKYSSLIWAAVLAYFIWDEVPAWEVWVGASVIILSSLYMLHRELYWSKKDPKQNRIKKSLIKTKLLALMMRG